MQLEFNGAVVPGSSASTSYLNAHGFGGRILKTPRFCGAGSWQEVATYSIPDLGTGYVTSGSPDSWKTGC